MVTINLILLVSLVLHNGKKPYVKDRSLNFEQPPQDEWNQMEAGLLIVAMCIVALTTLTLANESHWARSVSWTFPCFCVGGHHSRSRVT